jgi:Raf kinase inhibitor-like YbhB/YbcL family protein
MRKLTSTILTSMLLAGAGTAIGDTPKQSIKKPAQLTVTSEAVQNGVLATEYTCDGAEISPPLKWSTPPAQTKSVAVIVEDPDAPGKTFTHWMVTGIQPTTTTLSSGAALPEGSVASKNDKGNAGWAGPCPPSGQHRYIFHVFALDRSLDKQLTRDEFTKAIDGHVLAAGTLTATYKRQAK